MTQLTTEQYEMLMALYEERDSGNVDYLAPYVDVFNEVFRG